jgi:predicted MFS family arabinose efflux permease
MKELLRIYINSYKGLSNAAWMLAIVMLINRTGAMVLPFLGIYMSKELGFSIEEVGIVLAFFGIGAVLGSWFGGWLTDKFGNFWIQLISLLLSAPLFLLIPKFTSVVELSAMICVLSLTTETFRPANSVSVIRYAKPENITRAFSLNRLAMNLGFSIGPAMGGFLATISYDWIFYGNAIAALMAAFMFFKFFYKRKENRPVKSTVDKTAMVNEKIRSPYRDIPFLLFSLLTTLFAICFFQILNTMPLFYREIYQLNEQHVGFILGFSGLVIVLLEMVLVHFAERKWNATQTIVIGTIFCAFSFLCLAIPSGVWILYFSIFLLSMGEMLSMPFMASVSVLRASKSNQGAYMGLSALAFSIAHIFSPFIGTQLAESIGFQRLWYASALILVLIAVGYWIVIPRLTKKPLKND